MNMLKIDRRFIVRELKRIAESPESINLHHFISLVAVALVMLLERK